MSSSALLEPSSAKVFPSSPPRTDSRDVDDPPQFIGNQRPIVPADGYERHSLDQVQELEVQQRDTQNSVVGLGIELQDTCPQPKGTAYSVPDVMPSSYYEPLQDRIMIQEP
ncbi:MAG: hypothetical protein Q9200_000015 [Gallowayella weberi]